MSKTTEIWKQVGSVLVPAHLPEKVGLGCPLHDDHELVLFTRMQCDDERKLLEAFREKHAACRTLETLEVHDGRLRVTGELKVTE